MPAGGECSVGVNEKDGVSVRQKITIPLTYCILHFVCVFQSNVIFSVIEMPGKGTLPFLDGSVVLETA